ncbi:MAG: T9SS type A sorting domain-containing protein [Saprospiraceae bacterium]
MKKITFTFLLATLFTAGMFGQEVKKQVLIEHFTNSRCGICASKNPAFYNTINQYPGDIHHISYHPPVPYPNCAIYQSNTTGNEARANFYGVFGTPTIKVVGNVNSSGSALISTSTLNSVLNQTSPVGIGVEETTGDDRTVTVTIGSYMAPPTESHLLYVALVEKDYYYDAPNGEDVHHDVFREMLINGVDFEFAAQGGAKVITTTYNVGNYNPDELYVVAFLQSDVNDAILNSGTKFDADLPALTPTVSVTELAEQSTFSIYPNPSRTKTELFVTLKKEASLDTQLEIIDLAGKTVIRQEIAENTLQHRLNVAPLQAGIYFVKIQSGQKVWTEKLVLN